MLKRALFAVCLLGLAAFALMFEGSQAFMRAPTTFFAAIVIAFLACIGAAAAILLFRVGSPERPGAVAAALIGFAFTSFVAWRTIEDASREEAESRIAQEGYTLLGYEMEYPHLRCLYDFYHGTEASACLQQVYGTGDKGKWTQTLLYIEEVIWIFDESRQVEERYGAVYSDDIDYWREDVVDDVSGLFSYYIVEEAAQEHRREITRHRLAGPRSALPRLAACIAEETLSLAEIGRLSGRLCAKHADVVRNAPPGFFSRPPATWCTPGEDVIALCADAQRSD